jgi:hydroxypyruvate reductase
VTQPPKAFLRSLFDAALAAIEPADRLPSALPPAPADGPLIVVGAGKAAAAMALAAADHYGDRVSGVVVTRHGYGLRPGESLRRIQVLEASHPVPGAESLAAADALFAAVANLTAPDVVVALLSGGGSALLERPAEGLSLEALQAITVGLLNSGAAIGEINTVRKHLSAIKGGRLAVAAWPARVETFAISDVPGDDPSLIASGPTVADPSTCADALAILRRHGVAIPPAVEAALESGALETPKPGDPRLEHGRFQLVGSPGQALDGAARAARAAGFAVLDLGDRIEGEAATVATAHAAEAFVLAARGTPTVILSGGELTVTHSGRGSGGPNREYALALALALRGRADVWALAADTDGIDGAPDAAGAFVTPDTLSKAKTMGLDAEAALRDHDSGPFFASLGDALVTGPTRTNVSDFRAILVR